jgi:hypothetical protein
MKRPFAALIAILPWAGLAILFVVHPALQDVPIGERILRFFSFFTVISNLIVAITMTAIAFFPDTTVGRFFKNPGTIAAVAVYITIVAIVYSLFLRHVSEPQGWHIVSNHIVHDIVPPLFVLYWLIYGSKDGLSVVHPFKWLLLPLIYMTYALVRGAASSWYPYWFADVTKLGYPTALRNSGFVLIAFLVFGFIFAAIAKLLSRTADPSST